MRRRAERLCRGMLLIGVVGVIMSFLLHQSALSLVSLDDLESKLATAGLGTLFPHPHMGARDADGKWGYIHDTTYVRRHPPKFTFYPPEGNGTGVCSLPYGEGEEYFQGIWALHKIKVVNVPDNSKRVLCIVYTHSNRHHIVQAVAETYGRRCHGFLAASNQTNLTIGAVDIPHLGPESYDNMWQKVRSIWAYVHEHYFDEYDFFHIGGDNMFVIAENLIHACNTINISMHEPIYMGQAQADTRRKRRYCGGGAGYTMNRVALRLLVRHQFMKEECWPYHRGSDEDRIMGHCFRSDVVQCTHSTDELDQTRYHPMDAHFHAMYNSKVPAAWFPSSLVKHHGIYAMSREYLDSVSSTTVSFHLVRHSRDPYGSSPPSIFDDKGLRRYHAIVYNLCPNQNTSALNPADACFDPLNPGTSDRKCREEMAVKKRARENPNERTALSWLGSSFGRFAWKRSGEEKKLESAQKRIQTKPPVFVDFSEGPSVGLGTSEKLDHPYKGARDDEGEWGYVHDTTYLRRHPLNFTYFPPEANGTGVCDLPYGAGEEYFQGIWALHKIQVVKVPEDSKRVLCVVYTHSNRHHILEAIAETYGQRCHGFLAASNQTNRTIGAVNIPHLGPESPDNLWQKVRSILAYVHDHYREDYDFFHISHDNTFVIAENLIHACNAIDVSIHQPIYMGHAHAESKQKRRFCGGGAGYTINRATLHLLVRQQFTKEECRPNHEGSDEDRIMGQCLRSGKMECIHSTDFLDQTRYHTMDAHYHATYNSKVPSRWRAKALATYHGIEATSREYLESISSTTVSFHLARYTKNAYGSSPPSVFDDNGLRRYHAIVYNICPNQDTSALNPEDACFDPKFPGGTDIECRRMWEGARSDPNWTAPGNETRKSGEIDRERARSKAPMFVDFSGGPGVGLATSKARDHPFKGARDEKGEWGYVHDTTYLRRHPLNFTYLPPEGHGTGVCDLPYGEGEEYFQGIWALHKIKVVKVPEDSKRVLCIVYTHSNRHHILEAIAETYGQRCHGFLAASNLTNRTIGAVDIPHLGRESYDNMWQKVRSIWAYVHDHYREEYDFFHIGGDNMFLVAENLIHACNTINISMHEPLYMGQAQAESKQARRFCGGGAGYTINRATLHLLVRQQFTKEECWPDHEGSDEDRIMGQCLRSGIAQCTHSTDELDQTRYHPMDAHYHAMYNSKQPAAWRPGGLAKYHGIQAMSREYLDSVSSTTVSFHLVRFMGGAFGSSPPSIFDDSGLRRYHAIVYNICPNQNTSALNPADACFDPANAGPSDTACRALMKRKIEERNQGTNNGFTV